VNVKKYRALKRRWNLAADVNLLIIFSGDFKMERTLSRFGAFCVFVMPFWGAPGRMRKTPNFLRELRPSSSDFRLHPISARQVGAAGEVALFNHG
jgi:hypothetical protein